MAERAQDTHGYDNDGELILTGSSNAYIAATARQITGYYLGLRISGKANHTNTGAATLDVNGLGAVAIRKLTSVALVAGDIVSGQYYDFMYDFTNGWFQLLNPSVAANATTLGGLPLTSSGDRWGVIPFVHTDGVMEIGRMIDFHDSDADTGDRSVRLRSDTIPGTDLALFPSTGPDAGVAKRLVAMLNSTLAQGDVIYYDGTNFVRLAPGTAGQLLRTGGAAANPSWTGAASSIASGSLPAAANLDITSIPAIYAHLVLHISGISHDNGASQRPIIRASTNNGSSFSTTEYRNSAVNTSGSTTMTAPSTDSMISDITTRAAATTWIITLYIFGYSGGVFPFYMSGVDAVGTAHYLMDGRFTDTNAINALRITFSGGNIDAGTYALYGVL